MGTVKVFKRDGSLQCGMGKPISLDEMADELRSIGGEIISQEKNELPFYISAVCGAPTNSVNLYEITEASWDGIVDGIVGTLNFALWVFDNPTVQIYKYDGSLQCQPDSGISLDEMGKELTDKGIPILKSAKKTDGMRHITLCNASTGIVNVFEIDSTNYDAATKLGFSFYVSEELLLSMGPISNGGGSATFSSISTNGDGEYWPFPW